MNDFRFGMHVRTANRISNFMIKASSETAYARAICRISVFSVKYVDVLGTRINNLKGTRYS